MPAYDVVMVKPPDVTMDSKIATTGLVAELALFQRYYFIQWRSMFYFQRTPYVM